MPTNNSNKKNKLLKKGLLGLTMLGAVTAVASCATIEAELTNDEANQSLVADLNITGNTLEEIYDALVSSGDSNSETVLNQILLILANNQLGTFYDTTYNGSTLTGLSTVNANNSYSSFASTHTDAYPDSTVEGEGSTRAQIFFNFLLERINRTFMSMVGNTSYTEDNLFFEELFYKDIKSQLYNLEPVADTQFKGYVDGVSVGVNVEHSYPYDATTNYGTTQVQKYFQDDYLTVYKDYIERSILPDVLRSQLVSQYLYSRNYSVMGRSAARNLQFIALSDNSDYSTAAQNLVTSYAKLVLAGDPTSTGANSTLNAAERKAIKTAYWGNLYDLNFLDDLYKGYWDWGNLSDSLFSAITKIYSGAGFTTSDMIRPQMSDGSTPYIAYKQTTFGGILEDFEEINTDSRFNNDDDIYDDFTGSGAYSAEVGLELKIDELIAVDDTTEGWYTSSTIEGLPDTFTERLFKITVANDVDTSTTHEDGNEDLDYGYYVNNNYYLSRSTYVTDDSTDIGEDPTPILLYDSSTWYIVRVDEAVKASKMKVGGDYDLAGGETATLGSISSYDSSSLTYTRGHGVSYRDEIAVQIGYILSSNTSYTSNARQYYVEQAAISYHDDYVYDYFEATFPDLFDD